MGYYRLRVITALLPPKNQLGNTKNVLVITASTMFDRALKGESNDMLYATETGNLLDLRWQIRAQEHDQACRRVRRADCRWVVQCGSIVVQYTRRMCVQFLSFPHFAFSVVY